MFLNSLDFCYVFRSEECNSTEKNENDGDFLIHVQLSSLGFAYCVGG